MKVYGKVAKRLGVNGMADKMKRLAEKVIQQYQIFKPSVATRNVLYGLMERERKRAFGTMNPGKTFYIIRCIHSASPYYTGPIFNLLANHSYVLSHLAYAREKGYIPLIDQLNYPVYNNQSQPIHGTLNPWEFFWEQPNGNTLEEAYRSKHVILSRRNWISEWNLGYDVTRHKDPTTIAFLHELSETVPLNPPTQIYVQQQKERYFSGNPRILGVSYRFAGHAKNSYTKAPDHPIQPEIDGLIDMVGQRLKEWKINSIFLATESEDAVARFREAFGAQLIATQRVRQKEAMVYSADNPNPLYAAGAMYQTTLDYLTEMELLAGCTALLGTLTSGLRYAIIRNDAAYENLEILDFGRFADPRRRTKGLHS